ncbi:hypothetical protein [Lysinibacillus piscis]|uniref:Uncharacterized protein n=1 Tax=Lysinibacillus piscis TaxID=2518931 RepID=A0ABQ5NKH1_9BACI|nr:hypothetical protein [Lysinibacillus sp. KH24]GLC88856.1 hypothetical protein LYSBPC_19830 [Lysinibacillus sp. KH24]
MYALTNFKYLVDKQAEIDALYRQCDDLIQTTVTPQLEAETQQFLDSIDQKLTEQDFTITRTSTGLIANYQEAVINVDKHSKHLEECFFINLNSYAEDQISIVLTIKQVKVAKISQDVDGYAEVMEQMMDKLQQAKSLYNACKEPTFNYKTQGGIIFHSYDEVIAYYFG